jgi:hypothetical protein
LTQAQHTVPVSLLRFQLLQEAQLLSELLHKLDIFVRNLEIL